MKKKIWLILAGIFAALALVVIVKMDIPHWQRLDIDRLTRPPRSTVLYDRNGEPFGALYASENRVWVGLEEIPENVRNAFIAAEDLRFYSHSGFDLVRTFGALLADLRSGSLIQGGSTITQQLIKLTHLTSEKSLSRKAQEIVLAAQLERRMDKDEILECYLNTVYFGSGAYGVQTASRMYFGKDVGDIGAGEAATLAGIIKSPSGYSPYTAPEKAAARRNAVLDIMAENGFISMEEAAREKQAGLAVVQRMENKGSWYVDQVLSEAEAALGRSADEVMSGGYAVYTAYDPAAQARMDELFSNGASFPDPAADGTPCQAAMVAMDARTGGMLALAGGREYGVRRGLNRATGIARQPGSAFKPVSTYAAAVDRLGYLPSSMLDDTQREFADGYSPANAGGNYYGPVTMREALSRSLNVATVGLAEEIGIGAVREYAERFGIELSDRDANLSLALGSLTWGVSPAELCAAYAALANGGMAVEAHCVLRIESAEGAVLFAHMPEEHRAVKSETAYILTDMLKTAASEGSARALAQAGIPVAGKTGTVGMENGMTRDIWTTAYTPEVAVCAWMGFDQPDAEHALASYQGGSGFPARMCAALLRGMALSGEDFPMPTGLRRAVIDKLALARDGAVALAVEATPGSYAAAELFYPDGMPRTASTLWDAPETPEDLAVREEDGMPLVTFTSLDGDADYLLMRRDSDGRTVVAATLSGPAGEEIAYRDMDAPRGAYCAYSVVPRHRLLYQEGALVTGRESAQAVYQPGGAIARLLDSLMAPAETEETKSGAEPLFAP